MDLLYVVTLMVAIAAGAVAVLTSVLGLIRPNLQMQPDAPIQKVLSSRRLTNGALVLGFISLTASVVVHSRWGHGPGTVAPMDLGRLLSEHEAFPTVGAMLLLALVLDLYRSRRQRHALVGLMILSAVSSLSFDAIAQSSEPLRLPLSIIRSNPVTTITVGNRTVQAIVDTGGGGITLSEEVIRSASGVRLADERVWNDAFGREFRVPQFTMPVMIIGGQTFHDVVVIQAMAIPEGQGSAVPNMIGQHFLSRYFTVVDYAGLAMTLWPPDTEFESSAACGTTRIPMEQAEDPGLVVTEFDTPSGPVRLGWDTGATHSALSEALVASRRLETIVRGQTSFYRPTRLTAAGRDFGPLEFVVLPLQLPDFDGTIGANFFSDHVVCLDWAKREVRGR